MWRFNRLIKKILCLEIILTLSTSVFSQLSNEKSEPLDRVSQYNVLWNKPSKNESGSMPIGNGETALNVWALQSGEILFYIARTDAWTGNDRLSKLGRIKIKLTPNPFSASFEQCGIWVNV